MLHGNLRVGPGLPDNWTKLDFASCWDGQRRHIVADHKRLFIENETQTEVEELEVYGQKYQIKDSINVEYDEMM